MSASTVALLLATLGVAGAGQAAQKPDAPTNPITVLTGCLREGRADTTTANAKGVIYTLDAEIERLPTSPAPEGSGPVKPSSDRYALSFAKSVDLSKHVNHQVEVRGRVLPRGATEQAEREPQTAKPLPGAAQQMFHVDAIKMIAATCK